MGIPWRRGAIFFNVRSCRLTNSNQIRHSNPRREDVFIGASQAAKPPPPLRREAPCEGAVAQRSEFFCEFSTNAHTVWRSDQIRHISACTEERGACFHGRKRLQCQFILSPQLNVPSSIQRCCVLIIVEYSKAAPRPCFRDERKYHWWRAVCLRAANSRFKK